jgi:nucleoside-diphosphate-sugar epimerase
MILLTGANGFVGQTLHQYLLQQELTVRAVSRQTSSIHIIDAHTDWSSYLLDVHTVIHLAARAHIMDEKSKDPLAEFRKINVEGTINLAQQAAAAGVKRFIFLSSVKVHGEFTRDKPVTEKDLPAPIDPYGISKWEAEQALRQIEAETGIEVVIIRPPLIYGEGVKANFNKLLTLIDKGIPLPLALVNNYRSFIGLHNLVDFIRVCLTHPAAAGETFLISDDEDMSTSELIRRIAQSFQKSVWLIPVPIRIMRWAAIILGKRKAADRLLGSLQVKPSKAKHILNWQPVLPVQVQLDLTVQAYLKSKKYL